MPTILQVALPTPLRRSFDYLLPEGTEDTNHLVGRRVLVRFGAQRLVGVIIAICDHSDHPEDKLRRVDQLLDSSPSVPTPILDLCVWASQYYQHPIGEVLHCALPQQLRKADERPTAETETVWRLTTEGKGLPEGALRGQKQSAVHSWLLTHPVLTAYQQKQLGVQNSILHTLQTKGLIEAVTRPLEVSTADNELLAETPLRLNEEQTTALQAIRFHKYGTYLLDGATGSGKTEVYLHAIARVLQAGKQAMVLVPEIGLTPQTLKRFENRFQVPVVQLHSGVTATQRRRHWQAAATGRARVVIGTRLAVFTPMPNLGMIIIDEEHDPSFKQQDGVRYSARDVAVMRAFRADIPLLLGSATPALESLANAEDSRYQHLHLHQRAGDATKPDVVCIDMRKEPAANILSAPATAAIASALQRNEQALVFINRRGFAPALLCHNCGWSAQCTNCDAKMTVHSHPNHLRCHHCNQKRPVPKYCPSCHNRHLDTQGKGTERCEQMLQMLFPATKVIRVDQDSMQGANAMNELVKQMNSGEPCILVGTQMLAKGHHFPKITVVVLLDIDQGLFSGDFRGPERMGQLIVQVAGRAGRAELPGVVILQSYHPQHPLLQRLLTEGYNAFSQSLLHERRTVGLPPYHHMALLRAESKRPQIAEEFLHLAVQTAREIQPPSPDHRYLGPIPALLEKRNGRYRFQFQLCFTRRPDLQALLPILIERLEKSALASRTRWSIDVDPQEMA